MGENTVFSYCSSSQVNKIFILLTYESSRSTSLRSASPASYHTGGAVASPAAGFCRLGLQGRLHAPVGHRMKRPHQKDSSFLMRSFRIDISHLGTLMTMISWPAFQPNKKKKV